MLCIERLRKSAKGSWTQAGLVPYGSASNSQTMVWIRALYMSACIILEYRPFMTPNHHPRLLVYVSAFQGQDSRRKDSEEKRVETSVLFRSLSTQFRSLFHRHVPRSQVSIPNDPRSFSPSGTAHKFLPKIEACLHVYRIHRLILASPYTAFQPNPVPTRSELSVLPSATPLVLKSSIRNPFSRPTSQTSDLDLLSTSLAPIDALQTQQRIRHSVFQQLFSVGFVHAPERSRRWHGQGILGSIIIEVRHSDS